MTRILQVRDEIKTENCKLCRFVFQRQKFCPLILRALIHMKITAREYAKRSCDICNSLTFSKKIGIYEIMTKSCKLSRFVFSVRGFRFRPLILKLLISKVLWTNFLGMKPVMRVLACFPPSPFLKEFLEEFVNHVVVFSRVYFSEEKRQSVGFHPILSLKK